jgi:hypothetical protein
MQINDAAVLADRFDIALQATALASKAAAKKGSTAKFRKETDEALARRRKEIQALQTECEKAKQAQAALAVDPADANANLTVGRWKCLYKGEWEVGLPLLAQGSDETLKSLAKRELTAPAEADAQYELADSWWKIANKEIGLVRDQVHLHAAAWYDAAGPKLTSSVKKTILDRHLSEIAALRREAEKRTPQITHPKFLLNQWVDLLPLTDIKSYTVSGHWSRKEGEIAVPLQSAAALAFPVTVDGEYDLELTVTRVEGKGDIDVFLSFGPQQLCQIVSGSGADGGFGRVPGAASRSGRKPIDGQLPLLGDGKPHQILLTMRLSQPSGGMLTFYVDGRLRGEVKKTNTITPFVRDSWALPNLQQLGIGAQAAGITLSGARIRLISGSGAFAPSHSAPEGVEQQTAVPSSAAQELKPGEFRDLGPRGSILIGFHVGLTKDPASPNVDVVTGLRPIFLGPDGPMEGPTHGRVPSGSVQVIAKEGFAVGAMVVKANDAKHGFKLVIMKIDGDKLDPSEAYESNWIGGPAEAPWRQLAGKGGRIVGVFGTFSSILEEVGVISADVR